MTPRSPAVRSTSARRVASSGMRDYDVRVALRAHLDTEHANDLASTRFVEELGLCGESRVDLAVINGSLTGYELKSARDTLTRLPGQVATYGRVLDFAFLVVADNHLGHARAIIPAWWGVYVAKDTEDGVIVKQRRKARPNPRVDAYSLAQLLWREEALSLLTSRGLDAGVRSQPRHVLWERLAGELELDDLKDQVRDVLKARRGWRESPERRGSAATSPPSGRTPRFLARRLR